MVMKEGTKSPLRKKTEPTYTEPGVYVEEEIIDIDDIKRRNEKGNKNAKIRTVFFNNDIWAKLRKHAYDNETTITKILERAAEEFFRKRK